MRLIKFRGKETNLDDVTVYGIGFMTSTCAYDFLIMENLKVTAVKRNSVKQIVGWDVDDNEVYEDDVLVDEEGNEYIATLDANLYSTKDAVMRIWQPEACDVCTTKLKLKAGVDEHEEN